MIKKRGLFEGTKDSGVLVAKKKIEDGYNAFPRVFSLQNGRNLVSWLLSIIT